MLPCTLNPLSQPAAEQEQRELHGRTAFRRSAHRRKTLSALQSRNAVKELAALPGPEEDLHVICRGNFPLWQIVPAIMKLGGQTIDALHIATLGFSTQNATELLELLDAGKVKSAAIVCSVYFERQNPAEYRLMADGLAARSKKIVALRSHAKVIAIALADGRRFTIESSANLRSCRNIEQFTLAHSRSLYEFHRGWMDEVIASAAARTR